MPRQETKKVLGLLALLLIFLILPTRGLLLLPVYLLLTKSFLILVFCVIGFLWFIGAFTPQGAKMFNPIPKSDYGKALFIAIFLDLIDVACRMITILVPLSMPPGSMYKKFFQIFIAWKVIGNKDIAMLGSGGALAEMIGGGASGALDFIPTFTIATLLYKFELFPEMRDLRKMAGASRS